MDRNVAFETYLKKYAAMYCDGNIEVAKEHAIVKAVEESYKERDR